MEGNSERNYKYTTEEDDRLFILILVASFIIISMIIIIGSTACILLCFEESIEEKEEELQGKLMKLTEKKKKPKSPPAPAPSCSTSKKPPGSVIINNPMQTRLIRSSDTLHRIEHQISHKDEEEDLLTAEMRAVSVIRGDNNNDTEGHELRRSGGQERCSRAPGVQERCPGAGGNKTNKINGFKSESCLLEQLRVSENWRHLMAVEQGGQVKLNLKEQLSAKL